MTTLLSLILTGTTCVYFLSKLITNLPAESAHKQLAKLYFGKDEITDEEYNKAKQINFQAIYGKIPEEHKDLEIFKEIQEYIDNYVEKL